MRFNEITDKEKFVGNLKDPAAAELHSIIDILNKTASRGYSFSVFFADKELATIIGKPPGMDVVLQEINMIAYIKKMVNETQHWHYKTWRGDVEQEFAVYVLRKK